MELETAIAFTDALVFAQTGGHLNDLQQALLQASWSWERQNYEQIAEAYGYSATYLKHDVGPKLWKLLSEVLQEKVTKTSFRAAIERRYQTAPVAVPAIASVAVAPAPSLHHDWGEAIDVSHFYGREPEISQLAQWIGAERCRLVAILGLGGMGKTALSIKLAQRCLEFSESPFELLIWRSLRNAPSLQDWLTDCLQIISPADLPDAVEAKLGRLLSHLRSRRCLLVLDNLETVLSDPGYSELLKQIGETRHQSCLVLTSREKPRSVALLEGATLPVRAMNLGGLSSAAGQALVQLKGTFSGTEREWQQLVTGYSGNPLALKLISTTIQTLFDGNLSEFLQQGSFALGSVRALISQQFERLSFAQKTVLTGLAISREPIAFAALRSELTLPPAQLIELLEALEHQSWIERQGALFSLQPVVMEYVSDWLIEQIVAEIQNSAPQILKSHALLRTAAKDYIRVAQSRLILQPILDQLQTDTVNLFTVLWQPLAKLRHKLASEVGYAGGNLLNLLLQAQPELQDCDLSNLVLWQANFQNVTLQNVNLSDTDLSHASFTDTFGIVFTVAFSPDGKTLATGDAEGGLRLWQKGQLWRNLSGHQGWVWAVAFSADGRLASCSSDKTIRIWDIQTGDCQQVLDGQSGSIWAIAFSPDGSLLASGSDESTIKLWNLQTGSCRELTGQNGPILSLAFSNQILASGSADGNIYLWDLQTITHRILAQHTDRVWSVAFSHDGQHLASGSADGALCLWDLVSFTCLNRLSEHSNRVRAVCFSPDDQHLISSSDDQTLRQWQVQTGVCERVMRGHSNTIFALSYAADGHSFASGSADQTVRIWDAQTGSCLKVMQGYTNSLFSLTFCPNAGAGWQLAGGSTDQTIHLWQSDGQQATLRGHQGWVTAVAFHPEGKWLASASADQTVRIWDIQSQSCLRILQGHTNWVQSVAVGSQLLASGGDDRMVRLWDARTGEALRVLAGHTGWIWSVAFSPDGSRVASSSDDQTIRIWSVEGDCLQTLSGHNSRIQSVAFSPDGRWLASGSSDETVRIWDLDSGTCEQILCGHHNNVWSVAFSADGHLLASSSLDQTVRIWTLAGDCLQILPVPNQSVRASLAFDPASSSLLATGSHSDILLWDAATGQQLTRLISRRPYQGSNIARVTGITTAQIETLKALGMVERYALF